MLNWIKTIFESKEQTTPVEWRTMASIYTFLENNLDENGKLAATANDLPDEPVGDKGKLKFAPGFLDAMLAPKSDDEKVTLLVNLLKKIAQYGDKASEAKFYQAVTEDDNILGIIDPFLEQIIELPLEIRPYLLEFAKDMAFRTNNRSSVKFGIALLGLCHDLSTTQKIKILGLHDEFTLFSVVALINMIENPANDMWELAKKVDGWGKIHIVGRFVEMELTDEHRDWLVRHGYKNEIMYEYLAYTCAVHGLLHERLQQETIDPELFQSAGEIIEALMDVNGPAEDISFYEHGATTLEHYIRHAHSHTDNIHTFLVLHLIREHLLLIQDTPEEYAKNGWTQDSLSNCLIESTQLINGLDWKPKALEALHSTDNVLYWKGKQAAEKLTIDLWDIVWERLLKDPSDGATWYDVTSRATADKVDEVIQFAERTIPLEKLATGPADSMGFGKEFMMYQPLDYLIQFLEGYPKKGERIILTALHSPIIRNRNIALRVLASWKKENWSPAIHEQLQQLLKMEPVQDTKENVERLLKDESLHWG